MSAPQHPEPTADPRRLGLARRPVARSWAAGALVAISLALAACGSSRAPTILNTEKVERAIEHSILAQRGKHAQVSCPSGVHQKKGSVFSCAAVTKGGDTSFLVTELDGSGHVHYAAR